jgi:hypothetical protein
VSVIVEGDRSGRIRDAFAEVFSFVGFGIGENSSRYQLQARLSLSEALLPNQQGNKFVRYNLEGNFVDTATADILLPYNVIGWQSHPVLSLAQTRAVRAAENTIGEEYSRALSAYLFQLLPPK